MKEDILEQLVDDYLKMLGYFTRHNLKFKPDPKHPQFVSNQDSNHSDIDVIGFHPLMADPERVIVVSCKSWQGGFNVDQGIADLESNRNRAGRPAWKAFRELVEPKWSEAFMTTVQQVSGSRRFTYVTAVTVMKGDKRRWEDYPKFQQALEGNPVRIWPLADMLTRVFPELGTTVAASQLGRMLQLLKASGWTPEKR
jgi:hypothetical protein